MKTAYTQMSLDSLLAYLQAKENEGTLEPGTTEAVRNHSGNVMAAVRKRSPEAINLAVNLLGKVLIEWLLHRE